MKVLGVDIVDFFESDWPEDYYIDESSLTVDGHNIVDDETEEILPISEKYELSKFGYLCGAGNLSLTAFYSRWKKAKTTVTLFVEVPKEKEQEIREILKQTGVVVK